MSGTLYLISTPIGNLADLAPRAREALTRVAVCYAEDTRRTGRMLARLDVEASLRSLHAHNEAQRAEEIVSRLRDGLDCAIVSDAGTPSISDPGSRAVDAAHEAGCPVVPIPGPSAVPTALAVSGFAADRYAFLGFPPRSGRRRTEWFELLVALPLTVVVFESPRRLAATLSELVEHGLADRRAAVCRELTKLHEEIRRGTTAELARVYEAEEPRGEVTLVIEAGELPEVTTPAASPRARELAAAGHGARDIAETLREEFGLRRNEAYQLGLEAIGEVEGRVEGGE